MLNTCMLLGRLTSDLEVKETKNGKETIITIAVPRPYKNEKGEYENDLISCKLLKGISDNVINFCKHGDLIGVKGRLQTCSYELENGNNVNTIEVYAEKVTFLSNKKDV